MSTTTPVFSPVLKPYADRLELAGAVVLVTDKQHDLALEAVGFSDAGARTPLNTDAMFWIASMTKPLTGTALTMLVDEGRLDLDTPVEEFLPEFKGQMAIVERDEEHVLLRRPSHPITVKEVLNHTSGLPFRTLLEEPTLDLVHLPDAVRSYAMCPLQFEPGTQYLYSNAGTNTAARVLEVVSGQDYADFLQERLLTPLGMAETTFWPTGEQVERLARTHSPGDEGLGLVQTQTPFLHYPLTDPLRTAMPAGGLFSTASDIAKFCRMILNGGKWGGWRYLSEKAVKLMTSRQTAPGLSGYGLGWAVEDDCCGHGGALSTMMMIYPDRGLALVYLVQHMGFPGEGGNAYGAFRDAALAQFSPCAAGNS